VTLNHPDAHASSINYVDAVLGADSPYPLSPSSSSTPCVLARIMHSECTNFFHLTNGAATFPPLLQAVPFFLPPLRLFTDRSYCDKFGL